MDQFVNRSVTMSRPLRIQAPDLTYHVCARGNRKEDIYLDDADRYEFLALLSRVTETHVLECHAYCLMSNHYHLVATTLEPNLSSAIQALNGPYAQWWNVRHGRVGHVFQGRFKAQVVQDDSYMLTACRYVVLNPVRAGLVSSPDEWPWSSYRATAGLSTTPAFLSDRVLQSIGAGEASTSRLKYQALVTGSDNGVPPMTDAPVLGDPGFVAEFDSQREQAGAEVPRRERRRATLKELFAGAVTYEARNRQILRAHETGFSIAELATYLNLHRSTISKVVGRRGVRGVK